MAPDPDFIPVNTPLLAGNEVQYLTECVEEGWISSEGRFVGQFESLMASRVNREHGIAVSSGTAALDIAIEAMELQPGDEVILPGFTIISCVLQMVRRGIKPVFVDSDPLTWNMDVNAIESVITSETRAIMVVHIYGLPVDMDPVLALCTKHNLLMIEDAAEMHGQTYRGKPCGSFGDLSTFSFYANKHVTTGEGGMLVCDAPATAEHCRSLRNLCFEPDRRFVHDRLGFNYRMTNIQAAIGVAQLEQLDTFIEKKRRMGRLYTEGLNHLQQVQLPLSATEYADNVYWVYGLLLHDECPMDARELAERLSEHGIGTRPFFYPLHRQPVLNRLGIGNDDHLPVADRLYERGLYVPSGLGLSDSELERVVDVLSKLLS